MVERPPGRKDEWIVGVGLLDRRLVLDGMELAPPGRARGRLLVEEPRALVFERGNRPLQPFLLQAEVADPEPVRAEVGELVPDRLGVRVLGPVAAERAGEIDHDLAVDAGLAGARHCRPHAVHAPLRIGERAVLLREARRRQDDVGVLRRRVVQEDVLRDEELELREPLLDVVRVRLGLRRVLADQVERLHTAVVEARHHLVEPEAGPLRHLGAPRLRELPPHRRVVDGW